MYSCIYTLRAGVPSPRWILWMRIRACIRLWVHTSASVVMRGGMPINPADISSFNSAGQLGSWDELGCMRSAQCVCTVVAIARFRSHPRFLLSSPLLSSPLLSSPLLSSPLLSSPLFSSLLLSSPLLSSPLLSSPLVSSRATAAKYPFSSDITVVKNRNAFDKLVDYVLGDGPNNRFALHSIVVIVT